jgi:hypothetical protein
VPQNRKSIDEKCSDAMLFACVSSSSCTKMARQHGGRTENISMQYYTLSADYTIGGPFTAASMMEMQAAGALTPETPAAAAGDTSWVPLGDLLPAIREDLENAHPPPNPEDFKAQVNAARRSGPPTLPVLARLLREDAAMTFPHPRKKPVASAPGAARRP